MLVRKLSAEVGYAARLRWVEVELKPLVTGAEVVDLKAPMAFAAFVAKFTESILALNGQVQYLLDDWTTWPWNGLDFSVPKQ